MTLRFSIPFAYGHKTAIMRCRLLPQWYNLEVDDVIIGIDGKRVKNFAELQEGLAKHRPGDKGTVKVLRDKKEKDIEMKIKYLAVISII